MLDKVRKLTKNTAIYGFGNALNKLLGIILIPMYTGYISIADFGILAVMEITILALIQILNFGTVNGHQRYFYIEKGKGEYGVFLFTLFVGCLLVSVAALLPGFLFSESLSHLLFGRSEFGFLLILTLIITLIENQYTFPLQVLQFEERPVPYLVLNIGKLVVSLGLTIYMVVSLKMGLYGIMWARLIGAAIFFVISYFWVIMPRLTYRFSLTKMTESMRFGLPVIVSSFGFLALQMGDRYMLNWLSTEAATGQYSFGQKVANIINLIFVQSIGISYLPNIFSQENAENNSRFYSKMLTYYTFILSWFVLFFLLFYKALLLPLVSNMEYWDGLSVVPMLSLSFIILGMNYFLIVGIFLKNRTMLYIIPSFSAGISCLVLLYFLIPVMGIEGAALANLLAQVVSTGLIAIITMRLYKVSFEWKKVFILLGLATALFLAGATVNFDNLLLRSAYRLVLIIAYPVLLFYLRFFEPIEIETIKNGLLKAKTLFIKRRT